MYTLFFIILASFAIIWSVISFFLPAERYMKWYYRQYAKDYKKYDAKVFKIAHSAAELIIGILAIVVYYTDYDADNLFMPLMLAIVVAYYIAVFKLAKKKGD